MDDPERTYLRLVRDEISYHYAIDIMVKQLHFAVTEKKDSLANFYVEELKSIGDKLGDELERALIRLECARATFKLGNLDAAIDELNHAILLLEPLADETTFHKHYYAVAEWMLGSLLKRSTSKRREAIIAWQNSLDAFNKLIFLTGHHSTDEKWYKERCNVMYGHIERMVKERILETPGQQPKPAKKEKQQKLPISSLYSGGLSYLDVVGMIPAGGFGPSGLDPYLLERINLNSVMDEFIINRKKHKIYNLRKDDRIITLITSEKYFVLEVVGDSMDKAYIDPGDYVLMREQNSADNGSIVAAEIINEDNQATLKVFTKFNGIIVLRPRSTNKNHKEYRFTDSEQGFNIRGIALAVFKQDEY